MQRTIKSIRAILLAIVLVVGVFAATAAPVYAAPPTISNLQLLNRNITETSIIFSINFDDGSPGTGTTTLYFAIFTGDPGILTANQVISPSGQVSEGQMLISGVTAGYVVTPGANLTSNTQYTLYVVASNDDGPSAVAQLAFTTLATITSASSFSCITGTGGTFQATVAGTAPVTSWSLGGTVPAGVSINSSGLITVAGTVPAGTYNFTITATNATGPSVPQSFTLTVTAAGGGGGGGTTGGGGGAAATTGVSPKTDDATGGNMFLLVMMLLLAAGAVYTGRKAVKAKR